MKSKLELWKLVQRQFEEDLRNEFSDNIAICDSVSMLEVQNDITEDEMDILHDELEEYGIAIGIHKGLFWDKNDIESRREFIKEKIKYYESNILGNVFKEIDEAFEFLGSAGSKYEKTISDFESAFAKAFPKRYRKEKEFMKKIDDLTAEYCEEFFDVNIFCHDCPLVGSHCEGSNCGTQMGAYFSNLSRSEFSRKLFEVFGGRFYSFSRRIKNELLNVN